MFWICAGNGVNRGMLSLLLSSAYKVEAFPASHTTLPARRLGVHKKLGGDTAGTAEQGDIPCHMTSCSAIKAEGQEGGRGDVQGYGVCLPKSLLHVMKPGFRGDG